MLPFGPTCVAIICPPKTRKVIAQFTTTGIAPLAERIAPETKTAEAADGAASL